MPPRAPHVPAPVVAPAEPPAPPPPPPSDFAAEVQVLTAENARLAAELDVAKAVLRDFRFWYNEFVNSAKQPPELTGVLQRVAAIIG